MSANYGLKKCTHCNSSHLFFSGGTIESGKPGCIKTQTCSICGFVHTLIEVEIEKAGHNETGFLKE